MIRIKGLHKKFGPLTVLDDLDLEINSGGIYAILGPNGSGKTTLIKSILGMVIPNSGEIYYKDQLVLKQWAYRSTIAYLPQIANFPHNLTVLELIKMVKNLREVDSREDRLIDQFGLTPFLDKKLGNLSGGTKQKVNLVLTFMFESDLIILDEPTTGLDPVVLVELKKIIQEEKNKGKTILLTTHIMSLVDEIADEVVFLLDGKIYFNGNVDTLKAEAQEINLEKAIANLIRQKHA